MRRTTHARSTLVSPGVNPCLREGAKLACAAGDANGCYKLALQYAQGDGVAEDAARAAELYRKACDGGAAIACHHLGGLHEEGEGVSKDDTRAKELYQKACEGGIAQACSAAAP